VGADVLPTWIAATLFGGIPLTLHPWLNGADIVEAARATAPGDA
jgi:hypothetical protein